MKSPYSGWLCDDSVTSSQIRLAAKRPSHLTETQAILDYFYNMMWLSKVKDNLRLLAIMVSYGFKRQSKAVTLLTIPCFTTRNLQLVSKAFLDNHGFYIWPEHAAARGHLDPPQSSDLSQLSFDFWNMTRRRPQHHSQGPIYATDARNPGKVKREGTKRYRNETEEILDVQLWDGASTSIAEQLSHFKRIANFSLLTDTPSLVRLYRNLIGELPDEAELERLRDQVIGGMWRLNEDIRNAELQSFGKKPKCSTLRYMEYCVILWTAQHPMLGTVVISTRS
ncbi:uncharacterized protein MYCFIDRAFT_176223 [Pseudocercospora fijiensis CIRAD86]|uniref:Uncharacterized protein n=1 Tax=Pseudocercospora fijiensis (strain CIRAD86) TaxID=383855 RepID=M2YT12_PSEFD|nr:uncharacterized protein MYCFIDRAFT_176223 [Pseudocercospora fijiensis CIRAD86]EME80855.1 hypothetical protein MYCFIDRAFT_176223 [Pseudocercospora fijiensis CIRAD86]